MLRLTSYVSFWLSITLLSCGCDASQAVSKLNPIPLASPAIQTSPDSAAKFKTFDDFIADRALSLGGYRVTKRDKTVRVADYPKPVDVTYAIVTRKGKLVSKFEGFAGNYYPLGNTTDLGLFSFLGGRSKQLVVEQTQPRNWTHWIVDFSPRYHIVFDGPTWGVTRELAYADIDGDGIQEISQAVPAFVFFENLTNATSHLIDVVFRYDRKTKQYLPANQTFQKYSLAGIGDQIKGLDKSDALKFKSDVLFVVLRYIYAGKRDEAWSFYNREYNLPDKEPLRGKILATLRDEPVYKFLYR